MQHISIFLFFILTITLSAKNQTTHIAKLNLNTHAGAMQSICLLLTSDKQKVITRSDKNIDIWSAKDLEHLGRIKNVKHGWGCDLHHNDRYFLVHDLRGIALYDLQTLKHVKNFKKPDKKHGDSLMSASFSNDGKTINTYENIVVEPRLRKPFLFHYNIASGKRERIKAFPVQMNSNKLHKDTLYISDMHKNDSVTVYNIETDKQRKGNKKDMQIYNSLRGWWDCRDNMSQTKICQINNGIKYSLASGDLVRSELNVTTKIEPKITFMQRKPLRKVYFYETEFKWPYLINKSTQQYYGWDISKGKQIWSIRRKVTVSAEFDSVPSSGMYFLKDQDRAIIITGFTDNILDFNIRTGLFHYLPKYEDIVAYHSISLSEDNKVLSLIATKQKKPYPLKTHYFEVDTWKKLSNYDPSDFKAASTEHLTHYTASYNSTSFILLRRKNNARLATFHNLVNGEWFVMTSQGYFNASSFNVLVNILKEKHQETTMSNMQAFAKKWYRPDIVEAILTEKDFSTLENKPSNFSLPLKALDNNTFKESLKEMISKDKRLEMLKLFKRNSSREDIPFLFKGIENAKDQKTYNAYYESLTYYPFHVRKLKVKIKPFIKSRIETLNEHPLEQAPLLNYIYKKRRHDLENRKVYILDIFNKTKLTDKAKLVIAKHCKSKTFETLEPLLWDVWEKQFYVSKGVKAYLTKADPKRTKKAENTADKQHEKNALASIPKTYEKLFKTKEYTKERNTVQRELAQLYDTMNDLNSTTNLSIQKKIAMANLDALFKQTEFNPYTVTPYLKFMMKYGSEIEKKILHTKIEIYILSFYKETRKHNTFPLNDLLKDYFIYRPEFVLKSMIKLTKSPVRRVRSDMASNMSHLKDPQFVPYLLKLLDFKDQMVSNSALNTLLRYDSNVTRQVILKLNELKECSKITYLDISNSAIARKVDKATYATYRCGN